MTKDMEVKKQDAQTPATQARMASPRTAPFDADVYERDDALVVVADLPGCDDQSVDIHVERGVLSIDGRVEPESLEGYRIDFAEYRPTNFRRSFTLSSDVDVARIEATMKDGVLRLVLPKGEEAKTRKIEIKPA